MPSSIGKSELCKNSLMAQQHISYKLQIDNLQIMTFYEVSRQQAGYRTAATALDKVKAVKSRVLGFKNVGRYCSKPDEA